MEQVQQFGFFGSILLGTLGVIVGLVVTFYGYAIFRLILPVLGLFYGFILGKSFFPDSPVWGWVLGILFAIALAALAYAYWSALMTIGGAFIGFSLGYMIGDWIGLWSWTNVIIGVVLGAGFALMYFLFKDLMVMVWTAFAGAGIIFTGLAVFWPTLLGWLGNSSNWLTFILTIVVGVIGTIAQMFIFSGLAYYSEPPAGGPPYVGAPASQAQ